MNAVHRFFSLIFGCKSGDNAPRLRIQPHISFRIFLRADYFSIITNSAYKSVVVPALFQCLGKLRLNIVNIFNVFAVVFQDSHFFNSCHRIVKLECNKSRFTLSAQTETVVPVGMKSGRHIMIAETFHGESYCIFQMIVNRSFAAVCINDDFVKEINVSAFSDILDDSREQPQRIVCTVRGMTCFLNVFGVVGSILMTCIVIKLNKRKSAAVVHLSGKHESDLFGSHFRIKMNNSLNILNRIAIAIAVSKTAVNK